MRALRSRALLFAMPRCGARGMRERPGKIRLRLCGSRSNPTRGGDAVARSSEEHRMDRAMKTEKKKKYVKPQIVYREKIEVLAVVCDSNWNGVSACRII